MDNLNPRGRRIVGLSMLVSGLAMAVAGAYMLASTDLGVPGGVLFGAGVLDLVIGLFFLRG